MRSSQAAFSARKLENDQNKCLLAFPGDTQVDVDKGVATKFRLGRRIPTGGTDSGESKPPTPKFRFFLGFRPLYFGNVGKSGNFDKYPENFI